MATRRGPRFKECRRLGVNVCGHPKAMNRAKDPAFVKKHKVSEYGLQLLEKQKAEAYYNLLERQFVRYYQAAVKKPGNTGEHLIISLECRLDNLVYRMGFANSIRMARQMVTHGHFLVDGKKLNIPSFAVKPGTTITLIEKSRKSVQFKNCFLNQNRTALPYISIDEENFCGTLTTMPARADIPVLVNEQMIVEFYSK